MVSDDVDTVVGLMEVDDDKRFPLAVFWLYVCLVCTFLGGEAGLWSATSSLKFIQLCFFSNSITGWKLLYLASLGP